MMKKINLYDSMPDSAWAELAGDIPGQTSVENPVYGHLQYCLSELAEFKRALATSQQQLTASQLQIETLSVNKTRLSKN